MPRKTAKFLYYRCGNVASILEIDEGGNKTPKMFDAVPEADRKEIYDEFIILGIVGFHI